MDLLVALTILAVVLLVVRLVVQRKKYPNYPDGPIGLPLLGYMPFLPHDHSPTLIALSNKYGSIFSLKLGLQDVVFVSDLEAIQQSMVKDSFNYRTTFDFFSTFLTSSYVYWVGQESKDHRKFALRLFHLIGLGKQEIEDIVNTETSYLIEKLKEHGEKPIPVRRILGSAVSNMVGKLIFDERYNYEDQTRVFLDDSILALEVLRPSILGPGNYSPLLAYLMRWTPGSECSQYIETYKPMIAFISSKMEKHKNTFNPETDTAVCFMQAYLKEWCIQNETTEFKDDFHLYGCSLEFFAAGSNAARDYMVWFILFMLLRPEIQQKMREEVDDVIGKEAPSLKHKSQMPYTQAVLLEVLRYSILLPIGVVHALSRNEKLGEYIIPKGTHVIMNLAHVMRNPKYFSDPYKFNPDRFIVDGQFVKDDRVIGFGSGKRTCPGAPIAQVLTFILSCRLLQSFTLHAAEGAVLNEEGEVESIQRIPKTPVECAFHSRE